MKIRNKVILGVVVLLFAAATLPAREVSAVWTRLYRRAVSDEQRYSIMQNVVDLDDPAMIPLLAEALQEINTTRLNRKTVSDRARANELTLLIIRELGDLKAAEAAEAVWVVVEEADDDYLVSEALMSIGKMGNREYADDITLILRNLNFNYNDRYQDRTSEALAFGAVGALERLKQIDTWEQVFYASIGWYSPQSRVRLLATRAMATITDNPTESVLDIITGNKEYAVHIEALRVLEASGASAEDKVGAAAAALRVGVQNSTDDIRAAVVLSNLRKTALGMLGAYGARRDDVVPDLMKVVENRWDDNERLFAVEALKANPSDVSVGALVEYLRFQNEKRAAGVVLPDERIVTAIIFALGDMGNMLALEELYQVQYSNWSNSIIRASKAALEVLEGN